MPAPHRAVSTASKLMSRRSFPERQATAVVTAKVTSAHPLSAEQLKALAANLKTRVGRDVQIATTVDPAILGGLVVQLGSQLIDGSIRTRLNSFAQAMKG